jgi:site-specific DNA-methyltransferase (adenine-specific)
MSVQSNKEPYWEKNNGTGKKISFYLEDCVRGMQDILSEKSVDLVVTSPPYNIRINYSTHQDNLPRQDYLAWMDRIAESVKQVLKDDGSFFLNVGNIPRDQWIALDVAQVVRRHLNLQNVIHWIKSISINRADAGNSHGLKEDTSFWHFKPI